MFIQTQKGEMINLDKVAAIHAYRKSFDIDGEVYYIRFYQNLFTDGEASNVYTEVEYFDKESWEAAKEKLEFLIEQPNGINIRSLE